MHWQLTLRVLNLNNNFPWGILHPNSAFVPKVIKPGYLCIEVEVQAFHPSLSETPAEENLQHLCPVRALWIYLERTQGFRRCENLFVFCKP